MNANTEPERYGWSVADWAAAAGISRASVYNLLSAKQLETVVYGRKRIILTHPAVWLRSLKAEAA